MANPGHLTGVTDYVHAHDREDPTSIIPRPKQTEDVFEMAASRFIEDESGTDTPRHPHNGYNAGDFSKMPLTVPDLQLTFFKPLHARSDAPRTWQ